MARFFARESLALLFVLAMAAWCYWPNRSHAANSHGDVYDYSIPALNFIQGKGLVNIAYGVKYPPVHPFGFSLILAPAYYLVGPFIGNGSYAIYTSALLWVLLLYVFARRLFDRRVAFWAALFLAASPEVISRMSWIEPDITSACFILAGFLLLVIALDRPDSSLWLWLLAGQFFGYCITIRYENVLLLPPLGLLWAWRIRHQQRAWTKSLFFGGGIFVWASALLVADYLYTGSFFRTGYHLHISSVFDRQRGSLDWMRIFKTKNVVGGGSVFSTFSNFRQMLTILKGQLYVDEFDQDVIKWRAAYCLAAFFFIGVWRIGRCAMTDRRVRDVFLVAGTWLVTLTLYFVGYTGIADRYFLRLLPYLAIVDAVGVVTVLTFVTTRLSRLVEPLLQKSFSTMDAALWTRVIVFHVYLAFLVPLIAFAVYSRLQPFRDADWRPGAEFIYYVQNLIPEDNALIICNYNPHYVEHFLVGNTHRQLLLLHRDMYEAHFFVQWKKPPHPEWITEDCPDTDVQPRYKRMFLNGAVDMYPTAARENPQIIDQALADGRAVYYVCPGIFTYQDYATIAALKEHYGFDYIKTGFPEAVKIRKEFGQYEAAYALVRLGNKPAGTTLQMGADGSVQLSQ